VDIFFWYRLTQVVLDIKGPLNGLFLLFIVQATSSRCRRNDRPRWRPLRLFPVIRRYQRPRQMIGNLGYNFPIHIYC